MAEVDLEVLAAGYRYRPATAAALQRPVRAASGLARGSVVVDVGGGQGEHAAVFAGLGHGTVVVDPGYTMIRRAQRRSPVVAGRGGALPLADESVALLYSHLSIHYFDVSAFLGEAYRVLRRGHRLWIWTMGPRHFESSFMARFFPDVVAIDTARFPDPEGVAESLSEHDMRCVAHEVEVEPKRVAAGQWREFMAAGAISSWQLLSDDARADGLAAFDRAFPDPHEQIVYELRFDVIVAERP